MIDRSVLLPLLLDEAFALFTVQIGQWWPQDRRHLNDPHSQLFLLESGRFFERASNGTELDLGRVRLWQAPHRIVLDFFCRHRRRASHRSRDHVHRRRGRNTGQRQPSAEREESGVMG